MRITKALVVRFGVCGASPVVRAEEAPDCKACSVDRKICRQAHSQHACDSEYAICEKHCARK
jgi:hypothetical protein